MKRLLSPQLWATILSVLHLVTNLMLAAVLSRLLSISDYGIYATILSIVTIAATLAQFGFVEILMRETAVFKSDRAGRLRSLWRTVDYMILPLLIVVMIIVFGLSFTTAFGDQGAAVGAVAALNVFAMCFSGLRTGALRGLGQANIAMVIYSIIPRWIAISGIFIFWLVFNEASVFMAFTFLLVGVLVAVGLQQTLRNRAVGKSVNSVYGKPYRRYLLLQSLPMAGIAGLGIFNSQVDVLMLGMLAGPSAAALFQVCIQTMAVLMLIRMQLGYTIAADVARLWKAGDVSAIPLICRPASVTNAGVSMAVFVAIVLFGEMYLEAVFGAEFGQASLSLIIVAAAWLIASTFGMVGTVMIMTGHQKYTLFSSGVSMLINIVLNLMLVPTYGPVGAAISLVVSVVWWNASLWWVARVKLGVDLSLFAGLSVFRSGGDRPSF